MNRSQKPCKTAANHAPTFGKTMGGNVANADETTTMNHTQSNQTRNAPRTRNVARNFDVIRNDDETAPNYELITSMGVTLARFEWLTIGGVRVSTDELQCSPARLEYVGIDGDATTHSDVGAVYCQGVRITEVEQ